MALQQSTGTIRRLTDAMNAAGTRPSSPDEAAARRAAQLLGDESPLRPPPFGARPQPSLEFVGALGRLSEAFREVRGAIDGIDDKIESLHKTIGQTKQNVDGVRDRLTVENARLEAFDERMAAVEERQAAAWSAIDDRIAGLTRQVSFALGLAMMLGVLGGVALYVVR